MSLALLAQPTVATVAPAKQSPPKNTLALPREEVSMSPVNTADTSSMSIAPFADSLNFVSAPPASEMPPASLPTDAGLSSQSTPEEKMPFWQERKVKIVAAAVATLAVLGGGGLLLYKLHEAQTLLKEQAERLTALTKKRPKDNLKPAEPLQKKSIDPKTASASDTNDKSTLALASGVTLGLGLLTLPNAVGTISSVTPTMTNILAASFNVVASLVSGIVTFVSAGLSAILSSSFMPSLALLGGAFVLWRASRK